MDKHVQFYFCELEGDQKSFIHKKQDKLLIFPRLLTIIVKVYSIEYVLKDINNVL